MLLQILHNNLSLVPYLPLVLLPSVAEAHPLVFRSVRVSSIEIGLSWTEPAQRKSLKSLPTPNLTLIGSYSERFRFLSWRALTTSLVKCWLRLGMFFHLILRQSPPIFAYLSELEQCQMLKLALRSRWLCYYLRHDYT